MGRSLGTRSCILCMFSVLLAEALMPVKLETTALPPLQRRLLEQLWRPSLKLPDKLLRNRLKNEGSLQKLLTNGSIVKVVAFGGSVTVGHQRSNTSYADQLVEWLRAAFPAADVRLVNLARRATAAAFAAMCIVQALPEDADLVLIEYSINGYGGECQCFTSAQTAGYEALLRKVITKAPGASLLAFASFIWLDKDKQPSRYYETGEDQHSMLCKRYGIPMVSARDGLWDLMSNQQQVTGQAELAGDAGQPQLQHRLGGLPDVQGVGQEHQGRQQLPAASSQQHGTAQQQSARLRARFAPCLWLTPVMDYLSCKVSAAMGAFQTFLEVSLAGALHSLSARPPCFLTRPFTMH